MTGLHTIYTEHTVGLPTVYIEHPSTLNIVYTEHMCMIFKNYLHRTPMMG